MNLIEKSHGTIEGYFSAIGIGSDEQEKIKAKLTNPLEYNLEKLSQSA